MGCVGRSVFNLILAFISSFILVAVHKYFTGLPSVVYLSLIQLFQALVFINLLLASFNLIPIPPLDGSKILMRFLPPKYNSYFIMLERYGFIIIMILLVTGVLSKLILGPVNFLLGVFLFIPKILFSMI